jgi:hypothetical protein
MLLSLSPLLIIFIRKVYHHAILNLLRVVCIFVFFHHLVLNIPGLVTPTGPFSPADSSFIKAGFQLGEFTLLLYLFKRMITQKRVREFLNIFLVAFLSVVITIYFLKGVEVYAFTVWLIQCAILVVLAVVIFVQLVADNEIILFREPLFWIAGGILCYSGMILFMEYVTRFQRNLPGMIQQEKELVLAVAGIVRLLLFNVAALSGKPKSQI